ncbi:unnamed protein product [Rotaria magnacalcarata]|uniref:Uncharacterized protein n=2 Tax=Rotaria magnacalcarata TaxID=392030 RepID=A0A816ZK61_9BILA|nr:unnamed protein product [Rotaria magnacalcarata]
MVVVFLFIFLVTFVYYGGVLHLGHYFLDHGLYLHGHGGGGLGHYGHYLGHVHGVHLVHLGHYGHYLGHVHGVHLVHLLGLYLGLLLGHLLLFFLYLGLLHLLLFFLYLGLLLHLGHYFLDHGGGHCLGGVLDLYLHGFLGGVGGVFYYGGGHFGGVLHDYYLFLYLYFFHLHFQSYPTGYVLSVRKSC